MEMNQELHIIVTAAIKARAQYESDMRNIANKLNNMLEMLQSEGIVFKLDGDANDLKTQKQAAFIKEENCIVIYG